MSNIHTSTNPNYKQKKWIQQLLPVAAYMVVIPEQLVEGRSYDANILTSVRQPSTRIVRTVNGGLLFFNMRIALKNSCVYYLRIRLREMVQLVLFQYPSTK